MAFITASKLYDYIMCPHRIWRDMYGPQDEKIQETNPFVQLLWDRGVFHEEAVLQKCGEYLNLSDGVSEQRIQKTKEALNSGVPLIYHGLITYENLKGEPDLLRKLQDGTYIPIDIKSGRGYEGSTDDNEENLKMKKHYAVQLALYSEILNKLGFSKTNTGIIYDIDYNEVFYDLNLPLNSKDKRTFVQYYEEIKQEVALLLDNRARNKPSSAGSCKLCPWHLSCKKWVKENHDLTSIYYLGRSQRDTLNEDLGIERIEEIESINLPEVLDKKAQDKNFLRGIGDKTIEKIKKRARIIISNGNPVIYCDLSLPQTEYELFFDIEDDPTQAFIYLHGIYERHDGKERFIPFVAKDLSRESEKEAWREFWSYIKSLEGGYSVYYYAPHEKTNYKKLQQQYPDVISKEEVEEFFDRDNTIDLYTAVIAKNTDWPLPSYSLKEIAVYLGFKWRDETPSGALSIQWYNNYLQTKDPAILERILLYNEDDCKATMIIKDYLCNSHGDVANG